MGTKFLFICDACGYKAELSGGKDCGFVAVVQTMTCHDCNDLEDVLIGAYGKEGKTEDIEMNVQNAKDQMLFSGIKENLAQNVMEK